MGRSSARSSRSSARRCLILFVIGDVLGAGIYALVGEVGGEGGGAIWAAFLAAGATRNDLPVVLVGIAFICVIAAINFRGISES